MATDPLPGDRVFPYPYGSDLHWFWGWGDRIQAFFIDDQREPNRHVWMIFRPDRAAVDAMMRFSIQYPALIQIVERYLRDANEYFDKFLDSPNETTAGNFVESACNLRERIRVAVETIANTQFPQAEMHLSVDETECRIKIGDEWHELTPNQTTALAALVAANGDWVSLADIGVRSRDLDKLPPPVAKIVDRSPGKGARIKLA